MFLPFHTRFNHQSKPPKRTNGDLELTQPVTPTWSVKRAKKQGRTKGGSSILVCAKCAAIPLEIFQTWPRSNATRIQFGDVLNPDSMYASTAAPAGCCYQHYSGRNALKALSTSSKAGCPLCTILWFSLEASRQSLPRSALNIPKTPELPRRLRTQTGITLHACDDIHFIVRDSVRWSLVRFSTGSRVNEKGSKLQLQLKLGRII
jgi:hypothetical protein